MTVCETGYKIQVPNNCYAEVLLGEEVREVLSEAAFQASEGTVQILVNWQKAVDDFIMYGPVFNVPCKVLSPTDYIGVNDYYLDFFLHQMFLALNLASPGCCTYTKIGTHRDDLPDLLSQSLELRGHAGKPYTLSSSDSWPSISSIPLSDTWSWLQSLNSDIHPIAQTRIERALFALLHLGKENEVSPTRLIWLAYALEALFDTPDLGINKTLRDRIFLVLGKPTSHIKPIKKAIYSFYELRSSLVHGDLEIAYPFVGPSLYPECAELENKIKTDTDLAIAIVWATLQFLVRKNWRSIEFSESFSGLPL